MERTAKAVVLAAPEAKIRTAVEAVSTDEAKLAFIVAKQHEPLAEERHRHHRALAVQLLDQGGRLPVSAQHLARGLTLARAGDPIVELLADHGSSPKDRAAVKRPDSLRNGSG